MNKKQKEQIYKAVYITRVCERYNMTLDDYMLLKSRSNRLCNIFTRQCNGYRTWDYKEDEVAMKRDEKREKSITKLIASQCEGLGIRFFIQSDPRGATLYISKDKIPENDYTKATLIY